MTAAEIRMAAEQLASDPTGHTLKDAFRMIAELAAAVERDRGLRRDLIPPSATKPVITLKQKPHD